MLHTNIIISIIIIIILYFDSWLPIQILLAIEFPIFSREKGNRMNRKDSLLNVLIYLKKHWITVN